MKGWNITRWETKKIAVFAPGNKKELESLLGQTHFYSKYLPRYSELIEPFAKLPKNNIEVSWTQRQTITFETLENQKQKKENNDKDL